jgi:hypothetical protein
MYDLQYFVSDPTKPLGSLNITFGAQIDRTFSFAPHFAGQLTG